MKRIYYGVLCALLLASCGSDKRTAQSVSVQLDYSGAAHETAVDSAFSYGDSLFIGGMTSLGDKLVCMNDGGNGQLFFSVSADELKAGTPFGHRGNAGNEFVAPQLVDGASGNAFFVIDNGKKLLSKVNADNGAVEESRPLEMTDAVNFPAMLDESHIAYLSFSPKAVQLCLFDIAKNERTDTLTLADGSAEEEYALATNGEYAVVTFLTQHKLIIAQLSADKSGIENYKECTAKEENSAGERVFYSDAACTDSKVVLLSQEAMDLASEEGHSTLEYVDFSGKVLRVVKLPLIADKMTVAGGKVFLTSPMDNLLHVVDAK